MSKRITRKLAWLLLQELIKEGDPNRNHSEREFISKFLDILPETKSVDEKQQLEMSLRSMYRFSIGENCNGVTFKENGEIKELSIQIWISIFGEISNHPDIAEIKDDFKEEAQRVLKNFFSLKILNDFFKKCLSS